MGEKVRTRTFLLADIFNDLNVKQTKAERLAYADPKLKFKAKFGKAWQDFLKAEIGKLHVADKEHKYSDTFLIGARSGLYNTLGDALVEPTKQRPKQSVKRLNVLRIESNDSQKQDDVLSVTHSLRYQWYLWGVVGNTWDGINLPKGENMFLGTLPLPESDKLTEDINLRMKKAIAELVYIYTNQGDTVKVLDMYANAELQEVIKSMGRKLEYVKVPDKLKLQVLDYVGTYDLEQEDVKNTYKEDLMYIKDASKNKVFGDKLNKIAHQDCYEYLKGIPNKAVDLVLTDVPYNVSVKGTQGMYANGKVGGDFGDWDDGSFSVTDYLNTVAPKVSEHGALVCFNSFRNVEEMADVLVKNGFYIMGTYAWEKTNPIPHIPELWAVNSFEQFIWAVKDPSYYTYNVLGANLHRGYENLLLKYSHFEEGNKRFHTTQKPYSMWQHLVKLFSNRGDVVMDNFSGSGVNAVSCISTKRNYLGCELDDTYYQKSIDRIRDFRYHDNRGKSLF